MVKFKNTELVNLLKVMLDSDIDVFSEENLLQIEELNLNARNFVGEYNFIDLNELKYFKNLKTLKLSNMDISEEDIEILKTFKLLKDISFMTCNFDKCEKLADLKLEKLALNDCSIDDESFIYKMKELKELVVIKGFLNFAKMKEFNYLLKLDIASSTVINVGEINLPKLKEFIINFSNIEDLNFVLKLNTIKKISISGDQIQNNENILHTLFTNGVDIYENNMIKYRED